ncbi:MAG TPA: polysaccharide deacetylase family protein [Acidobacteriaceae bacterium]|nr:polysaccharide deacetylase family protein [Acidobacteriaceae bacterium]
MKIAISSTMDRLGMFGILRRAMATRSGLILALHRVLPLQERHLCYDPRLVLSEPAFLSLLRLLQEEYEVVHLQELLANPRGANGRPKVALTFDDGWEDNYRIAFPHLMAYKTPATIFACAGLLDTVGALPEERFARIWKKCQSQTQLQELTRDLNHWGIGHEKQREPLKNRLYWSNELRRMPIAAALLLLEHLERRYEITALSSGRFLRWNDLRAMMRTGLVRAGSHTCRHATLSVENARDVRGELEESRALIYKNTGVLPELLSYPNGMFNRQVMDIARAVGFQAALSNHSGLANSRSNPFSMPRVLINDCNVTNADVQLSPSRTSAHFARSWLHSEVY